MANDNQRVGLIDLNYNFFIEVLGEWVEHYARNKSIKTKYRKFSFEKSIESEKKINKCREFVIELTVKERLQFDFSYSGWLIGHKYKRSLRFKLAQVFLNNMLGGYTYVRNYKWHNKAMVTNIYLVKNLTTNKYIKFVGISFLKNKLFEHFGQEKMKTLEKMTKDYDVIVSTNIGVKNHIDKLKLSDEDVNFYDNFDIKSIEENRDEGDGIFHFIEAKKDEKTGEESDVNLDENGEDED